MCCPIPASRSILSLLCALTALLCLAAPASASRTQTTYFEAPRDLRDAATLSSAFTTMESLGVRAVRQVLYWQDVAPNATSKTKPDFNTTDPAAYDWSRYDPIVEGVKSRGWKLLLTVSGPVPKWATEKKTDNVTRPKAAEFTAFMTAVIRHYGAKVDVWSIWNEPNQPQFLKPQFDSKGHAYSPRLYRVLYRGALKAFNTAGLRPTVLFGETSPRGTGKVVAPLTFLRIALCLSTKYKLGKGCGRIPAAGVAHHAYTTRLGPYFTPPGPHDVTIGVLPRLVRFLDRAGKAGALVKKTPIWLTEFGIQSTPDPLYGVSLQQQNEYRAISEHVAYAQSRVVSFSQYLLRDDLPIEGVSETARYGGFESGLLTSAGKAKPALDGFRLPLVATKRSASKVTLWGLVRPASGATRVTLQYRSGSKGSWHAIGTASTNSHGYFSASASYRKSRQYRVGWSSNGTVVYGAPTRAYSAP